MFEITYNDTDALERYEEEKRTYPGAKYDFTFEKRFLVYHADIQSLSSALDVALEEFKTLQARLIEIDEPLDSFDPKLFEEVIKGMTVNNRDEMTFRLIGDLTFTVRL